MKAIGKVYAHIPARGGSKRVPSKNLRYLSGKPLIVYAIECAKAAGIFDKIFVNTDSDLISALAKEQNVDVYHRRADLASDTATGDDFTADFMAKATPDTLVMISPVCPFVEANDIQEALNTYQHSDCDTLITCGNTQMQSFCNGKAVNINPDTPLAPSQENAVVQILNWAVTIWDVKTFLKNYRRNGSGYIGNNRYLMPIAPIKCLKISNEDDFIMAELLMHSKQQLKFKEKEPTYWTPSLAKEKLLGK